MVEPCRSCVIGDLLSDCIHELNPRPLPITWNSRAQRLCLQRRRLHDRRCIDAGDSGPAAFGHGNFDYLAQNLENTDNASFAVDGESPKKWPADEDGLGPQGDCLDDIGAAPHTAIEVDFQLTLAGRHSLGKHFDGRQGVVQMAPAVVGNYDAISADFGAKLDVLARQYALGDNGKFRGGLDPG